MQRNKGMSRIIYRRHDILVEKLAPSADFLWNPQVQPVQRTRHKEDIPIIMLSSNYMLICPQLMSTEPFLTIKTMSIILIKVVFKILNKLDNRCKDKVSNTTIQLITYLGWVAVNGVQDIFLMSRFQVPPCTRNH